MGEAALKREFAKQPPREPLDSIGALWADYMWRYVRAGRQDPCVYWTEKAPSLQEAIARACDSRGEDGKMFFHQSKVTQEARDHYSANLRYEENYACLEDAIAVREDFEAIFEVCNYVGDCVPGIGPVTVYDVTSRLAAWGKIEAAWLHFHAGVEEGLKALGVELPRGVKTIHRTDLPRFFWDKDMDTAESFFCGYRSEIERIMRDD